MRSNKVIFVMGVSGSGKSTIGKLLSKELQIPFFDGDDYHSKENILKMSQGIALNDFDRVGWLSELNRLARNQVLKSSCVIVCSALKESYRELLNSGIEKNVEWVYLSGGFEQILERVNSRKGHFMPAELLQSQFNVLEEPQNALHINIGLTPKEIVEKVKKNIGTTSEFGLFGLGVMGKSLARNLASKGFKISMYNRHVDGQEENVASDFKKEFVELSGAQAFDDVEAFVNAIEKPRKIMLMVNAGNITDVVIENLISFLSEGDVLIDGGNSNYLKTKERGDYLNTKGVKFIGAGVSGGEEGALKGPSIMPGGNKEAYGLVKSFLESIAAKDDSGLPCCTYIGEEGSGHFVKMVHNGIEYVEMQLLAEVYYVFKSAGKTSDEIADILELWKSNANSYLLEITIDILRKKEGLDFLLDKVVDKAGNKGTGNWTAIASAQLGVPSTLVTAALFSRYTSFFKEERLLANTNFGLKVENENFDVENLYEGYQFARIINHYQGFRLISQASKVYQWNLNLSEIARVWTNGCIIKSDLMVHLISILKENDNILTHKSIIQELKSLKPSVNQLVSQCVLKDLPISCLSEAVHFLNAYTTGYSSANLIQAQRDYFGAHTYQRFDDASGEFHHSNWK